MFFTGHSRSLRAALQGGTSTVALFGACGMMLGSFGAGVMCGLNETDCDKSLTILSGSSTGAPPMAYSMSRIPQLGSTIYWQECCTNEFLDLRRRPPCGMRYLESIWKGATGKRLDARLVLRSKSRLMVVAVDAATGEMLYITPETEEEVFSVLAGGASSPMICNDEFFYQGKRIIDAVEMDPLPVEWFVNLPKEERPSRLLVIANRPYILRTDYRDPFMEAAEAAIQRTDIEVTVCWMPKGLGIKKFERRPEVVRRTVECGRTGWIEFMG